jgi:uncharacterized protein YecE (DUF72 family)
MTTALHDPGVDSARERADAIEAAAPIPPTPIVDGGAPIYVGTAGWTDATLTTPGVFYPRSATSPEARLRYYASRFPMVEVDSTYYALQQPATVYRWVERTPGVGPHPFRFCIKAHALLTGHPSEPSRLPADLRRVLPAALAEKARVYATDLPGEVMDEVRRRFALTVAPLASAGRLGAVLFQFPPWFGPTRENAATLAALKTGLGDLPIAVEFRNREWVNDRLRERTYALLAKHWLAFVMVDAPPGLKSSMPVPDADAIPVTSPFCAVVRLHGRRVETWEKPGVPVVERYRYLYDRPQLASWVPRVLDAARASREPQFQGVHVVFNNCYANYGTTNAIEFLDLLRAAGQDD